MDPEKKTEFHAKTADETFKEPDFQEQPFMTDDIKFPTTVISEIEQDMEIAHGGSSSTKPFTSFFPGSSFTAVCAEPPTSAPSVSPPIITQNEAFTAVQEHKDTPNADTDATTSAPLPPTTVEKPSIKSFSKSRQKYKRIKSKYIQQHVTLYTIIYTSSFIHCSDDSLGGVN